MDSAGPSRSFCIFSYQKRSVNMTRKNRLAKAFSTLCALALILALALPAAAAEPPLNDGAKAVYYAAYQGIVDEINAKYGGGVALRPMDELSEEDWLRPAEFRQLLEDIRNWELHWVTEPSTRSGVSAAKTAAVSAFGRSYTFRVTGRFTTQLSGNRQVFHSIDSLTSSLSSTTGSWRQTGYEHAFLDLSRTCFVTVSGRLTAAAATTTVVFDVEFYCNSTGTVT